MTAEASTPCDGCSEVDALRQRVADLEETVTEYAGTFELVREHLPTLLTEARFTASMREQIEAMTGAPAEELTSRLGSLPLGGMLGRVLGAGRGGSTVVGG